jgi:CHASE2 domain-containing sensor protein
MMSYGGDVISKIAPELRSIMPAILMFFYLLSSVASIVPLKKYGRKYLTIAGTIGLGITLYVISYAYFISDSNLPLSQILIVTCLFIYLLIYGLTYAPVMWMWMS